MVGDNVGNSGTDVVSIPVGETVGEKDGDSVGSYVGERVGAAVVGVSELFKGRTPDVGFSPPSSTSLPCCKYRLDTLRGDLFASAGPYVSFRNCSVP